MTGTFKLLTQYLKNVHAYWKKVESDFSRPGKPTDNMEFFTSKMAQ